MVKDEKIKKKGIFMNQKSLLFKNIWEEKKGEKKEKKRGKDYTDYNNK